MATVELARKTFGEAAELIETHLSVVVLTGDAAYKLKKSVRLPFVDQSEAQQRKELCLQEVELNRRFSGASLYLEVLGVAPEKDKFRLVPVDSPLAVDYCVKMRQFSQQDQGDNALRDGRISTDVIERFGRNVAEMYEPLPVVQSPGTERRDQMDNIIFLEAVSGVDQKLVKSLRDYLEAEGVRLGPLLESRKRKECHGDLHLSNTVLQDGQLVAFDCLEFNTDLRTIDPVADVAFFMMDLDSRSRSDLAAVFLTSYLEWSGDYEGLKLVTYYLIYRTLVRAKVASLSNDAARMQMHLNLAAAYMSRPSPLLVCMVGVSGSGKSFVAKHLVSPLAACRIRSDCIRKQMFGLTPLQHSTAGSIYSAEASARVYERVLQVARYALEQRISVIIDATNTRKSSRQAFANLAAETQSRFGMVVCRASKEVLLQRVHVRQLVGDDASEATDAVLERQLQTFEDVTAEEGALEIDTSRGLSPEDISSFAENFTVSPKSSKE